MAAFLPERGLAGVRVKYDTDNSQPTPVAISTFSDNESHPASRSNCRLPASR